MEIRTHRFVLREFTQGDETAFCAYYADPRFAEFCSPEEIEPHRIRALVQLFRTWAEEKPRRNYQLAVSNIADPQGLLGCCGLRTEGFQPGTAELGIELAPQYWGRHRYAIEISTALINFGFCDLDLKSLIGVTVSTNDRAARLARRFGFVEIGSRPENDWLHKQGWHQVEWELRRDSWAFIHKHSWR